MMEEGGSSFDDQSLVYRNQAIRESQIIRDTIEENISEIELPSDNMSSNISIQSSNMNKSQPKVVKRKPYQHAS